MESNHSVDPQGKSEERRKRLIDLPDDLLMTVIEFLPTQDIAPMSKVRTAFNGFSKDPFIWKNRFLRDFKGRYEAVKAEAAIDQAEEGAEESKASEPVATDAPTIDWHKAYRTAFWEKYGHLNKPDQLLVMAMMDSDLDALKQKITNDTLTLGSLHSLMVTDSTPLVIWLFRSSISARVVTFLFDKLVKSFYQREFSEEQQVGGVCPFDLWKLDGRNNTVLHYAAILGQVEEVEYLIDFGAEVNAAREGDGVTPLMFASQYGCDTTVAQLIAAGADVNMGDRDRVTALMRATLNGHTEIVRQLIAAGANVNGATALIMAVENGHAAIVMQLIAAGASINTVSINRLTTLVWAAQYGCEVIVAQLIAGGANDNEATALIRAVENGHAAVVMQLIAAGANINTVRGNGLATLVWAAQYGCEVIVAQLIAGGVDVNVAQMVRVTRSWGHADREDWVTALMRAAQNGHEGVVEQLIGARANTNAVNRHGETALMLAAQNGHEAIVSQLIAAEADVNAVQGGGLTASMLAAQNGHQRIVDQLKVAIRHREIELMSAAQDGHEAVVAQLITAKVGVNAVYEDGATALILAAQKGHAAIVAKLIAAGVNVNTADNSGMTALMFAARDGHTEIVRKLIAAGENVNAAREDGAAAFILATQNGHEGVVEQLSAVIGAGINASLDALNVRYEQENQWVPSLETSKASFLREVLDIIFEHQYETEGQSARSKATLVDALNYAAQLSFSQRRLLGVTNEQSTATRAIEGLAREVQASEDLQDDFVLHYKGHSLSSRGNDSHPGAAFVAALGMCGT